MTTYRDHSGFGVAANASGEPAARPALGTLHTVQMLRAVAAMLVVLFHGQQAFARRFAEPAFAEESYLFAFGAVGVHIFFVISGFIMVYTSRFEGGYDARAFFRSRLTRIYPIYWICAGLYVLIYGAIGAPYALSVSEAIGSLLLLPGHAAEIIGPAWTLAFEMFFYLCFGFAMMAGLNRGLMFLSTFFLSLITIGIFISFDSPFWALATNGLLLEFLAGAVIGWLLVSGYLPLRFGITVAILGCGLFVAGIIYGYNYLPSVIMWGIPSTLLVAGAVMAEAARPVREWVRYFGRFGDSSYALYLIHIIVIALAVKLAENVPVFQTIEPALASIPIALVALVIGELLYHRLEKPLLQYLKRSRT